MLLNSRYIELTSANRNRKRYPNPAQFTVEISTGYTVRSSFNASDPIFNSVIMYPPPNIDEPLTYPNSGYMFGPTINGGAAPSDNIIGILPVLLNNNNKLEILNPLTSPNAYVGDLLELVEQTVAGVTTVYNEFSEIIGYEVIPNYTYITAAVVGAPEPILTTSVALNTTCDIENFFTGWTVEFTSATDPNLVGITRTVEYYRAFDKRIFFDSPVLEATITAADTVALKTDLYQVQIETPFSIGALSTINTRCEDDNNIVYRIRANHITTPSSQGVLVSGTTTSFELPVSAGTRDYTGDTIWITSDPIVLSGALTNGGFVASGGVQVQGTFILPAAASVFPDDFLNNMTINITSGNFSDRSYIITSWDNATLTGTVDPGWTSVIAGVTNPVAADTFTITQPSPSQYSIISSYDTTTRIGIVSPPFSYTNVEGITTSYAVSSSSTYNILQYSHDNYHELNYPQSTVSQQQAHCYEISLISLTLPNVELKTGIGGKISEYPYVYVEFSSVTQGTSAYDFSSNNPVVSKNIMFRAPVIYNYRPEIARFLVLDGHGMCQILKFKPKDSFRFSVYLPNGELFTTQADYLPPSEPNPLLQITACFGVKRIQ